jgi:hypothetical protein
MCSAEPQEPTLRAKAFRQRQAKGLAHTVRSCRTSGGHAEQPLLEIGGTRALAAAQAVAQAA